MLNGDRHNRRDAAGHDTRAIQGWLGHRSIQHSRLQGAGAETGQRFRAGLILACSLGANMLDDGWVVLRHTAYGSAYLL